MVSKLLKLLGGRRDGGKAYKPGTQYKQHAWRPMTINQILTANYRAGRLAYSW